MGKEVVEDSSLVSHCLPFVLVFLFVLPALSISDSDNNWSLGI